MSRVGQWLLENRSWIPVPVVIGSLSTVEPLQLWTGVGVGMVTIAVLVRLWGVVHMGPESTSRKAVVSKLVYTGPYELTRNPQYLADIVLLSGIGMTAAGPALSATLTVAVTVIYSLVVRYEEEFLEGRLGEIYRSYKNRVPRWLGEAAPVHAAAPKGLMSVRVRSAFAAERATLIWPPIVTLMVLIRAATLG